MIRKGPAVQGLFCYWGFVLYSFLWENGLEGEGEAGGSGADVEAKSPIGLEVFVGGHVVGESSSAASAMATFGAVTTRRTFVGGYQHDAGAHKGSTCGSADDAGGLDSASNILCLLELRVWLGRRIHRIRRIHVAHLCGGFVEDAAKQPDRGSAEQGHTTGNNAGDAPSFL